MKKLKICFFIPNFKGGGAERQCVLLLNALQREKDIALSLVCFEEGVNFKYIEANGLQICKLSTNSYYDPRNFFKVNTAIKKIDPDILFSWILIADLYSFFASKLNPSLKWIMAERSSAYPKTFKQRLRDRAGKNADLVIANSRKGALYWKENGRRKDGVLVIPNILHEEPIMENVDLEGHPVFLYAGRLYDNKNVLYLAGAMCAYIQEFPNARGYIIGEGDLKDAVKSLIDSKGCSSFVLLLSYKENIQDYYRSADVFLNLSDREGMPNTVIENAMFGNRLIVSRIDEHLDILGKDYPYCVDDPKDENEILNCIRAAVNDIDFDSKLETARKNLADLDERRITDRYLAAFWGVLD